MKQSELPQREHLPTRAEAAGYLGVSVPTLARWASSGTGPVYYVIGGKARYRLADLDAYLESCRRIVSDPAHSDTMGQARPLTPCRRASATGPTLETPPV